MCVRSNLRGSKRAHSSDLPRALTGPPRLTAIFQTICLQQRRSDRQFNPTNSCPSGKRHLLPTKEADLYLDPVSRELRVHVHDVVG